LRKGIVILWTRVARGALLQLIEGLSEAVPRNLEGVAHRLGARTVF
jgi:hypothetical protein